jgi:hypothetical protein
MYETYPKSWFGIIMKKPLIFIILTLCFFLSIIFVRPYFLSQKDSLAAKGFLRTDGTIIRDGDGKEILLRGVNLGGLFLIEPWILGIDNMDQPPIEDEWTLRHTLTSRFGDIACKQWLQGFYDVFIQDFDLDLLQKLGINTVRLPINYRMLQNEDGSWIKNRSGQIDFEKIDKIVAACEARGLYVLLDLHGAPGSQNKERHSGRADFNRLLAPTPEGEMFRKRTVELWRTLADHYKNNAAICGYDLLNEPSAPENAPEKNRLWETYDRIYQAIRSVDRHHIIMMEAVWDWDSLPDPSQMGWKNIAYQFHYYDVLIQNDPVAQKAFVDKKIEEGLAKQSRYQIPVMIGEFTCLQHMPAWAYYLKRLDQAKWHWTFWTYKARDPSASWGLLHAPNNSPELPRFRTDSLDVLLKKISVYSSQTHYKINDELAELIRSFCL